eukprot:IDg2860t1
MPFWEVNSPVQHSTMNMNCAGTLKQKAKTGEIEQHSLCLSYKNPMRSDIQTSSTNACRASTQQIVVSVFPGSVSVRACIIFLNSHLRRNNLALTSSYIMLWSRFTVIEQLPFSEIGFVDCSLCVAPDTTLDTVRCQDEDNIDRMQTYFNLAVFKRQDEEKETPSTSIALNRSTGLKKYYSSFAQTKCTTCKTFGTPWTSAEAKSGMSSQECLRFALQLAFTMMSYLVPLVSCFEAAEYRMAEIMAKKKATVLRQQDNRNAVPLIRFANSEFLCGRRRLRFVTNEFSMRREHRKIELGSNAAYKHA